VNRFGNQTKFRSPSIAPIETVYNGRRYRSRHEARWAVGFDADRYAFSKTIPVYTAEYEPQGFNVGGRAYLPDFRLASSNIFGTQWVEVKPPHYLLTPEDSALFRGMATVEGMHGLMLVTGLDTGYLRFPHNGSEPHRIDRPLLHKEAIEVALAARFEHGETPTFEQVVDQGWTKMQAWLDAQDAAADDDWQRCLNDGVCFQCGDELETMFGENGEGGLEAFRVCSACGYLPLGVR
jgi:hypothetical protein